MRCAAAAALTVSYFLSVLCLHPWQPYWIRELSVMLVQLYAWKVFDLVLFRHGESLRPFGAFLLCDVLVLRPPALVLPPAEGGGAAAAVAIVQATGGKGREARKAAADAAAAKAQAPAATGMEGRRKSPWPGLRTPEGADLSPRTVMLGGAGGGCKALLSGSTSAGSLTCATAGGTASRHSSAAASDDGSAAAGKDPAACGSAAETAGSRQRGLWEAAGRLRLAAVVVVGPLHDFLWTYNVCEALNAYLMHRRGEDILAAPLLAQVWLSCCFAGALFFHLRYFFHSMEMLWLAGFALASGARLPRWQPLFNWVGLATSPEDFWNRRWHQMFRWWWTRLVFLPTRRALQRGFAALQQAEARGNSTGVASAESKMPQAASQKEREEEEEGSEPGVGDRPSLRASSGGAAGGGGPKPRRQGATGNTCGSGSSRSRSGKRGKGHGQRCGPQHRPGPRHRPRPAQEGNQAEHGSHREGEQRWRQRWVPALRRAVARRLLAVRGPAVQGLPVLAVFAFSAAFHESLLWINFGRPTGEQAAFFLLHASLLLAQRVLEAALCGRRSNGRNPDAPRPRQPVPEPSTARPWARTLLHQLQTVACWAGFMGVAALSSPLFFRPWFRNQYHKELRVLAYGPAGWAVRVWVLGLPREGVRLFT
ncbi:hypothetical protein HYH03_013084 [Edaphochlamys debaryana]|uniref:Wax synthase domain-containing protein n=1 Tax=Edaphochlamys debaryana TaxID=47281 RepID=A0A835XRL8_9CHLO|nr:hypothetical protein HYH03_013084 [Edaphochlamys debaryana]|eukprot:KAG2488400.1 hypothetical protein HYH03_013084 [Edaphochlamys debaryana]